MTEILTDAEYAQLSAAEQSQYWRRRYYDLERRYHALQADDKWYREALSRIRDEVERVTQA